MKERYKITCASYLLLLRNEQILLLRRFNTGYEDGKYSLPAGHTDEGESVAGTMIREAKEEVNITIEKDDLELAHVMHRKGSDANDERLDFFFLCKKWIGEIKNLEPNKCDDLLWVNINQLPDNILPYVKLAIKHSQKRIMYSDLGW